MTDFQCSDVTGSCFDADKIGGVVKLTNGEKERNSFDVFRPLPFYVQTFLLNGEWTCQFEQCHLLCITRRSRQG